MSGLLSRPGGKILPFLGTLLAIAALSLSGVVAAPPGSCTPWPGCRDGGGGGGDGKDATFFFSATIEGEYFDLAAQETRSFAVSIDTRVEVTSKFHVMVLPKVRITSIADSYQGPALTFPTPTAREQVPDYVYDSLGQDFGGFDYSQTWEAGSGNDFATGKPLKNMKVGQSTDVISFDVFVTERRDWNAPLGAVDYTLFLKWASTVSGVVLRTSETTWSFVFDLTFTGPVFQRLPWLDYANRIKDYENTVVLNPTVTYVGTGSLTQEP